MPQFPKKQIQCRVTDSGCFEVISHPIGTHGYPLAYLPYFCPTGPKRLRKKSMGIHRYIWAKHNGPIPEGMHVMHKCDNKICINPAHLTIGTLQDNMADKVAKNRHAKGETMGTSKLTNDIVNQILADQTSTHLQLSKKFGISRPHVTKIKNRQFWKHLTAAL